MATTKQTETKPRRGPVHDQELRDASLKAQVARYKELGIDMTDGAPNTDTAPVAKESK